MAISGGPYVRGAFFCQNVIREENGLLSVVQVFKDVLHKSEDPKPIGLYPEFQMQFKLVVFLVAGPCRGEKTIKLVQESPSGEISEIGSVTVAFIDSETIVNYVSNFLGIFNEEGVFWYSVYVDDEFMTAIPLSVHYEFTS